MISLLCFHCKNVVYGSVHFDLITQECCNSNVVEVFIQVLGPLMGEVMTSSLGNMLLHKAWNYHAHISLQRSSSLEVLNAKNLERETSVSARLSIMRKFTQSHQVKGCLLLITTQLLQLLSEYHSCWLIQVHQRSAQVAPLHIPKTWIYMYGSKS